MFVGAFYAANGLFCHNCSHLSFSQTTRKANTDDEPNRPVRYSRLSRPNLAFYKVIAVAVHRIRPSGASRGGSEALEPILKIHLGRCPVIQALVQTPIVVKVKVPAQTINCLSAITVLTEVNFLVLDRPPEPLRKDVVKDPTPAVHTDGYVRLLQPRSKVPAGELGALVSVEDLRPTDPESFFQRLHTE